MRTRIIYTEFFEDDYILSLTVKERYVFAFLLWNPGIGLSGMYKLSDKVLALCCGLTSTEVVNIKSRLAKDGKFYFWKDWVKVLNYEKYNSYKGEKNQIAYQRELALVPSEVIQYRYSIDRVSDTSDTPINHNIKGNINIIEGVVKGKPSPTDITLEFLEELKSKFPNHNIAEEWEKAKDWLSSTGETKHDYKAFFRNWLRRADPARKVSLSI
jgi:hypothetical protein